MDIFFPQQNLIHRYEVQTTNNGEGLNLLWKDIETNANDVCRLSL